MVRIQKSTNNIAPFVFATVVSLFSSFVIGAWSIPLWIVAFFLMKIGMSKDIDNLTQEDTKRIIRKARKTGEKSVIVKQTIPSGGSLIDLPMTLKYKVTFDDD